MPSVEKVKALLAVSAAPSRGSGLLSWVVGRVVAFVPWGLLWAVKALQQRLSAFRVY